MKELFYDASKESSDKFSDTLYSKSISSSKSHTVFKKSELYLDLTGDVLSSLFPVLIMLLFDSIEFSCSSSRVEF